MTDRKNLFYVEDCADHVLNFGTALSTIIQGSDDDQKATESVSDGNRDANVLDDVRKRVREQSFGFENFHLVWWPPPQVEGFETREIHSADALRQIEEKTRR